MIKLTCNQAMVLLDIYRGTLTQSRHMSTYFDDLQFLRSEKINLIDFYHDHKTETPVFVLTKKGENLVYHMLGKNHICKTKKLKSKIWIAA